MLLNSASCKVVVCLFENCCNLWQNSGMAWKWQLCWSSYQMFSIAVLNVQPVANLTHIFIVLYIHISRCASAPLGMPSCFALARPDSNPLSCSLHMVLGQTGSPWYGFFNQIWREWTTRTVNRFRFLLLTTLQPYSSWLPGRGISTCYFWEQA